MPGMSPPKTPATLLSGTGSHRHPIATANPEAQKFFDQGMTMAYGFNHEEAYRSFAKAAELDPKAAMPHWGMAFVLGSNYNDPAPADERLRKARAEVEQALALSGAGPENERAYVEALAIRYPADPSAADQAKVANDYAAAMKALAARYPDDLDAATFYAESLMNLTPWKLWTPAGEPGPNTVEIVAVLESVLKRNPDHPGANHFYIHATEASKSPERALPSAKRLETLVPAAGHLVHMPAHVYVRTGDYVAAEKSNTVAAEVDRAYIRETGAQGMYPVMYYNHNVHFESYAAAMAGQYARAKRTADKLSANVLPVVADMPMIEGFIPQQYYVLLRFAKWDEILALPAPAASLQLTTAIWHYARGAAFAAKKDAPRARAEQMLFQEAAGKIPPETPVGVLNTAGQLFAVAKPLLAGRIAAAGGDGAAAIEHYRTAVAAEDLLAYDEPPTWYYPVRETLGAALLASGKAVEAEQVFRDDLKYNPRNGRSLFGVWRALEAQGRKTDAARAAAEFRRVWSVADVPLRIDDL